MMRFLIHGFGTRALDLPRLALVLTGDLGNQFRISKNKNKKKKGVSACSKACTLAEGVTV